jgi:hypothetical protein
MPAHLVPIFDEASAEIQRISEAAFAAALASGPHRDQAELINDAHSIQAELAAVASSVFLLRLCACRPMYGADVVWAIARQDVIQRIDQQATFAIAAIAARGGLR